MEFLLADVYTIVTGLAISAASLILAAGRITKEVALG